MGSIVTIASSILSENERLASEQSDTVRAPSNWEHKHLQSIIYSRQPNRDGSEVVLLDTHSVPHFHTYEQCVAGRLSASPLGSVARRQLSNLRLLDCRLLDVFDLIDCCNLRKNTPLFA